MIPNNENKTLTLKTSSRYWLQEIGGILVVLIVFPIFAMLHWGSRFYFIGGLSLIVGVFSLLRDVKPALNSKILIARSEIKGQIDKLVFTESWNDIKAASFSGRGTTLQLTISTDKNTLQIPCKYFDEKELEKHLREYLPSEVFDPLAYQKLPQFQEWQRERVKRFTNLHEPLKVSLGKSERVVGSISIFFGLVMASLLFLNVNKIIPITFMVVFFGGLGLLLILWSVGNIEATNETIKLRTLFQEYELTWNTLREVYLSSNQLRMIALVSDKCRIVLPGPTNWSGKDREQFYELLSFKLETLGIQPMESAKFTYWRSKKF